MSLVFQRARKEIGTGFNWETDPVYAYILQKGTWTPAATDQFVADATGAGAIQMSSGQQITSPNAFIGGAVEYLGMDAMQFPGGFVPGDTFDGLLLYRFVSNDANSWMIAWFDAPAVIPNNVSTTQGVIFSPGGGAPLNIF